LQFILGCAPTPNLIDLDNLRSQMRKAKAEGRTVTVLNGCVYIDYQLKAQIPTGFNYDIWHLSMLIWKCTNFIASILNFKAVQQ